MVDMSKEFPSQTKNRDKWILETVREHQPQVNEMLFYLLSENPSMQLAARKVLNDIEHKQDRDALLQPNGLFTPRQLEILADSPKRRADAQSFIDSLPDNGD